MTATAITTETQERVLRVDDVARHLDCSRQAIYALIQREELRAVRIGRLIRVPESALEEFIAGQ